MKAVSHGSKWIAYLPPDDYIRTVLRDSGLSSLMFCTYYIIDKGLIVAFSERWHHETSSFHLLVGEMTITLNDVAALTHLKIDGVFMTPPRLTSVQAPPVLVQYLGMSPAEAHDEVVQQKGPSISFDKLKKICDARRVMDDQESRVIAGRAYLLLVIG